MNNNDFRLNAYIRGGAKKAASVPQNDDLPNSNDSQKANDLLKNSGFQKTNNLQKNNGSSKAEGSPKIDVFKPMKLDVFNSNKDNVKKPVFEHISNKKQEDFVSEKKQPLMYTSSLDSHNPNDGRDLLGVRSSEASDSSNSKKNVKQTAADFSEMIKNHGFIKIPVAPSEKGGRDSVARRVAKFLLIIGVDEAAKIMPYLPQEMVERIIPEIATIRNVEPDEAAVILAEFEELAQREKEGGGVNTAKNILEQAFGKEKANEMLQKSVPFAAGEPFEYLQKTDNEKLFFLLKDESAAVRAIVLSKLKPEKAAAVINRMSAEDKKDTVYRLAKLGSIAPDTLKRIDNAMREKAENLKTSPVDKMDGRGALAEILKRMSPDAEKSILSSLENVDPDMQADLRERLFTIDDVLNADDKFVQAQLRVMSDSDVAILIAGKDDKFRSKILENVSKGRGDIILEEEQLKSPIRKADSVEVSNRFISSLRRAWENGTLSIKGRDEDQYV